MAKKPQHGKPKPRPRVKPGEYRFRIDAYSPETIPMARLADYMAQLATILGEPAAVHFERLETGSTSLVHRIDREAEPKVRARVAAVQRGEGPTDACRAYQAINRLLRDDNGEGELRIGKRGAKILIFPGRRHVEEEYASIKQHGTLQGMVMRVGGTDVKVPVILQAEDRTITGCFTDRETAKRLAARLFEYVRLHGLGKWTRDGEGEWSLEEFRILDFEPLEDVSLTAALRDLRGVRIDWGADPLEDLEVLRHGPKRAGHGRN